MSASASPYSLSPYNSPAFVADIGIISDTHMPQRWGTLPAALFELFAGVDLILHAGDVGELWVLDQLSEIAPVIAVHGNDDTVAAQTQLPYQQLVQIAGKRILLWHSHHSDHEAEMRARLIDTWERILSHNAARAQQAGAHFVVLGHLHVPFFTSYNGIWILNPGAIASGSFLTRQSPQTVARMQLFRDDAPVVRHTDLAVLGESYQPAIEWEAPFTASLEKYSGSLVKKEIRAAANLITRRLFAQSPQAYEALIAPLAHRCWNGEQPEITIDELLRIIATIDGISPAERQSMPKSLLAAAGYRE